MSVMKIGTAKLQEMVSRSIKGAGNNRLIPLTSLVGIMLDGGKLTLTTTDGTNYLYVSENGVEGDDFNIAVPVDTFSKLVARMTCETITLELKENSLLVRGNGKYSIELPMDESGELVEYPDPVAEMQLEKTAEIGYSTVTAILNSVKPSLAVTLEEPCYTGYYVGKSVVATDAWTVAWMDTAVLDDAKLISPEMMNLLAVMTAEKINICIQDNIVVFYTDNCTVYGVAMDELEDFSIEKISELVKVKFKSVCKLARNAVLQLLDRLSLFVSAYDKNAVDLVFTKEGLQVSSKASDGIEVVPYLESKSFKAFKCSVDIDMLTTQIKAQSSDTIELYYGLDNAIKMVDGNITQIVSLMYNEKE